MAINPLIPVSLPTTSATPRSTRLPGMGEPPQAGDTLELLPTVAGDEGEYQDLMRQVHLFHRSRPEEGKSLAELRLEVMEQGRHSLAEIAALAGDSWKKEFENLGQTLEEPHLGQSRMMVEQVAKLRRKLPELQETLGVEGSKKIARHLAALSEGSSHLEGITELPRQSADGVARQFDYYVSPVGLAADLKQSGWDHDQATGLAIADAVVVGGGIGGLASGYQLAKRGFKTLVLEGERAGGAFSNQGAASVHVMRTSEELSSIIDVGGSARLVDNGTFNPAFNGEEARSGPTLVNNATVLNQFHHNARDAMRTQAGVEIRTNLPEPDGYNLDTACTRATLYGHLSHIADVVGRGENSRLIEHSRVKPPQVIRGGIEVVKEDGSVVTDDNLHFLVETEPGHKVLARRLVLSQGFTGSQGEYARVTPQFKELQAQHPDRFLLLGSDYDMAARAEEIAGTFKALRAGEQPRQQWLVNGRQLASPDVRRALAFHDQNQGQVVVAGSGESAYKDALEILTNYPNLKVKLLTSERTAVNQIQIPGTYMNDGRLNTTLYHPTGEGRDSFRFTKDHFGTPITPETVRALAEYQQDGRFKLLEMGKKVNSETVSFSPGPDGRTQVRILDAEVMENLSRQQSEFVDLGLDSGQEPVSPDQGSTDMIVFSVGYDRKALRTNPLTQALIDQGVLELAQDWSQGIPGEPRLDANGLVSAKCDRLAVVSAGMVGTASDTAIPGLRTRANKVAGFFNNESDPMQERDPEEFGKLLTSDVVFRDQTGLQTRTAIIRNNRFTNLALAQRQGTTLTPAQKLVVKRGLEHADQINPSLPDERQRPGGLEQNAAFLGYLRGI